MKRSPLKRGKTLRSKPKAKLTDQQLLLRAAWHLSVTRERGRVAPCIVCGNRGPRIQGHHVVAKSYIRDNIYDHWQRGEGPKEDAIERLTWADGRSGVPVCAACHEAHENASVRIARGALPLRTREWALEHNFDSYINRHYPEEG